MEGVASGSSMPLVDHALTLTVDRVDEKLLGEFGRCCDGKFRLLDVSSCAEDNALRE